MRINEFLLNFVLALVIVAVPFIIHLFFEGQITFPETSSSSQEEKEPNKNEEENEDNDEKQMYYWGVDSANKTDENLFQCVTDNFGHPEVWGRYLGDREGVSSGLDAAEVDYLHKQEIQILVIYNHVTDARGYDNGLEHAEQAIQFAQDVHLPDGVAIFGDIEPDYPIDHAFLEGWYDTLTDSNYEPGIYGVFSEESMLMEAFEAMEETGQENTIVWSAYPQEEITTQENAPAYHPEGPELAPILGWQYAIDAETCNIDTNLFTEKMLKYLW